MEYWQEDVGGHRSAQHIGDIDHHELSPVGVVLHGDPQQSDGRHEARHQRKSHGKDLGLVVSQEILLLGLLLASSKSDQHVNTLDSLSPGLSPVVQSDDGGDDEDGGQHQVVQQREPHLRLHCITRFGRLSIYLIC